MSSRGQETVNSSQIRSCWNQKPVEHAHDRSISWLQFLAFWLRHLDWWKHVDQEPWTIGSHSSRCICLGLTHSFNESHGISFSREMNHDMAILMAGPFKMSAQKVVRLAHELNLEKLPASDHRCCMDQQKVTPQLYTPFLCATCLCLVPTAPARYLKRSFLNDLAQNLLSSWLPLSQDGPLSMTSNPEWKKPKKMGEKSAELQKSLLNFDLNTSADFLELGFLMSTIPSWKVYRRGVYVKLLKIQEEHCQMTLGDKHEKTHIFDTRFTLNLQIRGAADIMEWMGRCQQDVFDCKRMIFMFNEAHLQVDIPKRTVTKYNPMVDGGTYQHHDHVIDFLDHLESINRIPFSNKRWRKRWPPKGTLRQKDGVRCGVEKVLSHCTPAGMSLTIWHCWVLKNKSK